MRQLLVVGLMVALVRPAFSQDAAPLASIAAGTGVEIELLQEITSDSVKAGQTIRFKLVRSIELNGETMLPAGAPVTGLVEMVRTSGKWRKTGVLKLTLQPLKLADGTVVHIDFPQPHKKGEKTEKVGEGVVDALYLPNYLFFPAAVIARAATSGKPYTVRSGERYLVYVTSTKVGPQATESPKH